MVSRLSHKQEIVRSNRTPSTNIMRKLPTKPNQKQQDIIDYVNNYYGIGITSQELKDSKAICRYFTKKSRKSYLSEKQLLTVLAMKEKLKDKIYLNDLLR